MNHLQEENWRKDPKNWKLGAFYHNREDKRLIVDKKNPNNGSTLNFAHPTSYLFLAIALAFFGFVVYMILNK